MIKPLISIIVPIYKVERFLDKCINSLINQSLKNIEIILVDDGSPDNCSKMCDEYQGFDNRIKVIHKHNQGAGLARNSGVKIATGEYIAYVDADDYVDLTMFENLYETASQNNFDAVFCGFYRVSPNLHISKFKKVDKLTIFNGSDEIKGFLLDIVGTEPNFSNDCRYKVSTWGGIYSHNVIDKFSILYESERVFFSEDTLYNICYLSKSKKIGFVPETYYYYRQNKTSISQSYSEDNFIKLKFQYFEIFKNLKEIMDFDDFTLRLSRNFIGNVRGIISIAVANISKISYYKIRDEIQTICQDILLQEVIIIYPIKKLPLGQKIFSICLKKSYINIIILLCFINNIRKH